MSMRAGTHGVAARASSSRRGPLGLILDLSGRLLFHVLMLAGCVVVLVPFVWMISSSFKTAADVIAFPPSWIPNPVVTDNYPQSLSILPMGTAYFNSFKISTLDTIGGLITCSMAAYAFARLRFPGRDVLFFAILATLMIPQEVSLIPLYILFKQLHMDRHALAADRAADAPEPLRRLPAAPVLPHHPSRAGRGGAHRRGQSLDHLHPDHPAAGGAGPDHPGHLHFSLQLEPVPHPADLSQQPENFTVPLLLSSYLSDYGSEWGLLMAACTIAMLPLIAVYALGQRYFIEGIALSGLKG